MAIDRITRYRVEPNRAGRWFFHEIAGNGEVIDTSGQSFSSKDAAMRACKNAKARAAAAPIEVHDPNAAMTALVRGLAASKAARDRQKSVLASLLDSRQQRRV
jgi:uncharacterized protein YegP (UPF0339 family)